MIIKNKKESKESLSSLQLRHMKKIKNAEVKECGKGKAFMIKKTRKD